MVAILIMSAKLTTKGYDVIIFVHDISNKILSHDSNYIVSLVM